VDDQNNGITLVIVSYDRNSTLKLLLKSLLKQKTNLPLEVYLINNWQGQTIKKSYWSTIGRLLLRFADVNVLNSSTNLGCSIRYSIANYAKYDTILFLDDDIELLSESFIQKMYDFLQSKGSCDIVSSWCATFRLDEVDYFNTDGSNFEITDHEVEVDLAGPGVCMFRKELLVKEVIDIPENYRDVDNVWFSIVPTLVKSSKKYYFPSKGMLRFVKNHVHAMFAREDINSLKRQSTKELVSRGYQPIRGRV